MKKDIRAYGYEELQKEMATIGEKAFRAKQIYEWLHVKLVDHFDAISTYKHTSRTGSHSSPSAILPAISALPPLACPVFASVLTKVNALR